MVVVLLLSIVGAYAAVGVVVGFMFVGRGVGRVDPVVKDSSWTFRMVILPGCIGLWPMVLLKWVQSTKGGAA